MTQASIKPQAIRLSVTPEVRRALRQAKQLYPTLSDPEILKLGLAKIITNNELLADNRDLAEIRRNAAYAVGNDYLDDPSENVYTVAMGKKVHFS